MYRDYDGQGHGFGDTSIEATTSDVEGTSVYASTDTADPGRVVIIAINKTGAARSATITLKAMRQFHSADVYTMTDGSPTPQRKPSLTLTNPGAFTFTMPEMSVSTLVLHE
jgi:hypothetical protein